MPEDHADRDGDVEGVLGTVLRNFQREITCVDDVLADAVDFVSEDYGIFGIRGRPEGIQLDGADGLLDGHEGVALFPEPADGLQGVVGVLPRDAVFGAEG